MGIYRFLSLLPSLSLSLSLCVCVCVCVCLLTCFFRLFGDRQFIDYFTFSFLRPHDAHTSPYRTTYSTVFRHAFTHIRCWPWWESFLEFSLFAPTILLSRVCGSLKFMFRGPNGMYRRGWIDS